MPVSLKLSDEVNTNAGPPRRDLSKGTADFDYGVPEKMRMDPTVNGAQNDEKIHHDDDDNFDNAEVATFTGTIRPYAMAPFVNGNVRPSTQQRKERRRMQNVLDTLDQKDLAAMSPIALKQYLTLAGRNSQSRADNIEDSAQSYRRRPLTAPLPECLAVADSQQYAQMEPISSFKSATRPWDADGPMRVLSDADLVVTRRCKAENRGFDHKAAARAYRRAAALGRNVAKKMEGGEGGLAIHGEVLPAENEMLFDDELGNDQESEEKNEDDSFGTFHDEDVETCYDGLTFADDGSIRSFYNETDENDSLLLDDFDDSASLDTYDTANTTTSRRKNNINNSSVSNSESSTSNTQQQKQRRQQQQKQSRRQTRQHPQQFEESQEIETYKEDQLPTAKHSDLYDELESPLSVASMNLIDRPLTANDNSIALSASDPWLLSGLSAKQSQSHPDLLPRMDHPFAREATSVQRPRTRSPLALAMRFAAQRAASSTKRRVHAREAKNAGKKTLGIAEGQPKLRRQQQQQEEEEEEGEETAKRSSRASFNSTIRVKTTGALSEGSALAFAMREPAAFSASNRGPAELAVAAVPVPMSPVVVQTARARKHRSRGGAIGATANMRTQKATTNVIKKEQRKASAEQKYAEQVATGLEERKKMLAFQELARTRRQEFRVPYGSDEVNDADYDLEDAEDDGNCNSGGSSSKSTQKKKKETKKNQRDAYRYHSSLSQQPVNNELNGRETRRIRAAAEMCKSKAISLENPITLQPKKGARGAGGSMIGDGKQALPGGYEYGDVVYSKIFFSFKGQSIAPGDKGVITGPCMSKSVTAKDRVSVDFENGMRVFAACAGSGEHQITREPPFDVAAAFGFDMSAESLESTAPFRTPEDSVAEAGTAATKTKSKSGGTEPGWSSSETEAIEKRARRAASAAAAAVTNGLTNLGMLDVGKAVSDDAAAGPGVTAALKLSPRRRHAMATALLQMAAKANPKHQLTIPGNQYPFDRPWPYDLQAPYSTELAHGPLEPATKRKQYGRPATADVLNKFTNSSTSAWVNRRVTPGPRPLSSSGVPRPAGRSKATGGAAMTALSPTLPCGNAQAPSRRPPSSSTIGFRLGGVPKTPTFKRLSPIGRAGSRS